MDEVYDMGIVGHTCSARRTRRGEPRVQGHLQRHIEFEANLGYMEPCVMGWDYSLMAKHLQSMFKGLE